MKKITGLVIVLAVLFVGGYYGMGIMTERTVKNNLAIVNQSNGLYASVVSYQRGWFKSQALLDWNIHIPARQIKDSNGQMETVPAQDYRVEMPLTIYHGPIIWSDHGLMFGLGYAHADLVLPAKLLKQFNSYFTKESTQPKMALSFMVDYGNNSQIQLTVPQFNLIAKKGAMTFDWMGMLTDMKTTGTLNEVSGHFDIEGVRFTQDKMILTFGKVSGKYNLHKTETGLFFGDARTILPSVVVTNNDEKMFELDEFSVDSRTNVDQGLFSASLKTSMDKLYTNGRVFGPGRLEIGVKNLDAGVLTNINAQINKAQQGNDLEKQQALLAVLPELPKLFAQGAVLEVSTLKLVVPEGEVNGDLIISLPAGSLSNPFELLQKIEGKGELKLPEELVKELVTQSLKQKLLLNAKPITQVAPEKPVVSDASKATEQMSEADKAVNDEKPAAAEKTEVATEKAAATGEKSTDVSPTTENPVTATPADTIGDISQQALAQTPQEIERMIQSGLIVKQGNEYLIAIKLDKGQLLVNGKPFNPAMLKF